jgi:Tfp pilus assembly protein PilF
MAIQLDSESAQAYRELGITLRLRGDHEGAVASFSRAIDIDPEHVETHSNLGWALWQLGKSDAAIASFSRAIAIDPEHVETHTNLGWAWWQLGKSDAAIASYRRVLKIDPKNVLAYRFLGMALKRQGKFEDADASYRKAIDVKPNDAAANNDFAWFLATAEQEEWRNAEDAVRFAWRAVNAAPNSWAFRNTLGVALYRAEEFVDALVELDRAMELHPGDANNSLFYAMALHRLGRSAAASESFEKGRAAVAAMAEVTDELERFLVEARETLARDGGSGR